MTDFVNHDPGSTLNLQFELTALQSLGIIFILGWTSTKEQKSPSFHCQCVVGVHFPHLSCDEGDRRNANLALMLHLVISKEMFLEAG